MDDRFKWLIVILLVVVAIGFGAYLYYLSLPITMDEYLSKLSKADSVSIVMDLRTVDDPGVRAKILQCGVDFAGSVPLGGKQVYIYALDENGTCIVSYPDEEHNGTLVYKSVDECLKEMYTTDQTILIRYGDHDQTDYYRDYMLITMSPEYSGRCGIIFVQ